MNRALVRTAELLVGDVHAATAAHHLVTERRPSAIHPVAVGALRDILTKGVTARLLRLGGRRFFEDPTARLRFGDASLDLLLWLTCEGVTRPRPLVTRGSWTAADEILLCRALSLVDSVGGRLQLAPAPPHTWLLEGARLVAAGVEPDFRPEGLEPWLLTAAQPALARAFVGWARAARAAPHAEIAFRHGEAQAHVLAGFLEWAEATERPELARFVLDALVELARLPDDAWTARAWPEAPLSRRQAARRAAMAIPRAATTLSAWTRRWSLVGWLDDGYDRAQWRLRQFEGAAEVAARFAPLLSASEALT